MLTNGQTYFANLAFTPQDFLKYVCSFFSIIYEKVDAIFQIKGTKTIMKKIFCT